VRAPTARGCASALIAVAVATAVMAVPGAMSDLPTLPRIQAFISAACGGSSPCPVPERERWLGELEGLLAERMPTLSENDRTRLADVIYDEAQSASLDPLFVIAVIAVESGFDHLAESEAGARGLMQLLPATLHREAERFRLPGDPDDPAFNVRAGIHYYRRLVRAFGSTELALMAYNAGPNRVLRFLDEEGSVPERFKDYPRRIERELGRLRREHDPKAGSLALAREAESGDQAPVKAER
jgi:soluble lytic murein transglycosylase-like protein